MGVVADANDVDPTAVYRPNTRLSLNPSKKVNYSPEKKGGKKKKAPDDSFDGGDYLEMLNNYDNTQDSKIIEYTGYSLGTAGIAALVYSTDINTIGSTFMQVSGGIPNIVDTAYGAIFQ